MSLNHLNLLTEFLRTTFRNEKKPFCGIYDTSFPLAELKQTSNSSHGIL